MPPLFFYIETTYVAGMYEIEIVPSFGPIMTCHKTNITSNTQHFIDALLRGTERETWKSQTVDLQVTKRD